MGTVRAEIAFPLENRGEPPAAVARGRRGGRAGARASRRCSTARPTSSPAASSSASRWPPRWRGARRSRSSTSRPRSSTRWPATSCSALLRRLNEEWGTAILLAEHRLERCLPAADRVVALDDGAVAFDGPPPSFLAWAAGAAPALLPPAAQLFAEAGLRPLPAGVKAARAALRGARAARARREAGRAPRRRRARRPRGARRRRRRCACAASGRSSPAARRPCAASTCASRPGERVALMGRNGAGKSTLLRVARGLLAPTRGRVRAGRAVALLLQHPGDYFLRDRVGDDAPPEALEAAGLGDRADRHPRDLSGGERQRLALALVLGAGPGDPPPAVVGLDEPTRGMDRARRDALAAELRALAARGAAVIVATHDAEFAAAFADRVVLLGDGRSVADGARRRGARRRLVLRHRDRPDPRRRRRSAAPRAGRRAAAGAAVADRGGGRRDLAARLVRPARRCALAAGFAWYERAHPPRPAVALVATLAALAALGRVAFAPLPNVKPTHRHRAHLGLRARRRAGLRRRRAGRAELELLLRPGAVDAVADGRLGRVRRRRRAARARHRRAARARPAGRGLRRSPAWPTARSWTSATGSRSTATTRAALVRRARRDLAAVQRRPRGRQRRLLPRLRAGARARPAALPHALRGDLAAGARRRAAGRARARGPRARPAPPPPRRRAPRRRRATCSRAQNGDGGFGARPRPALDPALHRLGGARRSPPPGATRSTCAAAGARRSTAIRAGLAGLTDTGELERTILVAARRPGSIRATSAAATSSATLRRRQRADGSLAEQVELRPRSRVLALRAGGLRRVGLARAARRRWLAAPAEPRRRLQLRRPRRPERASTTPAPRAGARRRRAARGTGAVGARRRASCAGQQNRDGGFPLNRGGGVERAVDRLGGPGAASPPGATRRPCAAAARSPLAYLRSLTAPDGSVRYSRTSGQTPVWVTAQALTALAGKALPARAGARAPRRRGRERRPPRGGRPRRRRRRAGRAARRPRRAGAAATRAGRRAPGSPAAVPALVRGRRRLAGPASAGYLLDSARRLGVGFPPLR